MRPLTWFRIVADPSVSTNHLVANTVNNWKCSVPCSSLATFLYVDFVLRIEQLPLTLVTALSYASLLSINPDALRLWIVWKYSSWDSFFKHMQIVNTYIAYNLWWYKLNSIKVQYIHLTIACMWALYIYIYVYIYIYIYIYIASL